MSASDVIQGRVVNITLDGTQLDLVSDQSFSFDAGENVADFDLATATTTQSIPEQATPTIEFDLRLEEADKSGLEELGVIDADGQYQFDTSSRSVPTVTVEYLSAESGLVEIEHSFSDVLFQIGSIDDDNPAVVDVTGHINGDIELAVNKTST